jgi:hypothetical protein
MVLMKHPTPKHRRLKVVGIARRLTRDAERKTFKLTRADYETSHVPAAL